MQNHVTTTAFCRNFTVNVVVNPYFIKPKTDIPHYTFFRQVLWEGVAWQKRGVAYVAISCAKNLTQYLPWTKPLWNFGKSAPLCLKSTVADFAVDPQCFCSKIHNNTIHCTFRGDFDFPVKVDVENLQRFRNKNLHAADLKSTPQLNFCGDCVCHVWMRIGILKISSTLV